MCFIRVNEFAKSTYAGKRGRVHAYCRGKSVWRLGSKYAKHVCLIFNNGWLAGRPMWFHIKELDMQLGKHHERSN